MSASRMSPRLALLFLAVGLGAPGRATAQEACVVSTRGLTGEQPNGFSLRLVSSSDATCRLDRAVVNVGSGHTLTTAGGITCQPTTWSFAGLNTATVTMTPPAGQGLSVGGSLNLCIADDVGQYWNTGQTLAVRLSCSGGPLELTGPYALFYENCGYKCAYISEARLGACGPVPGTLRLEAQSLPAADAGRFDLLVDGAVAASALGNGGSTALSVSPGEHLVTERPAAGTTAADYRTTFGGDCDPAGRVVVAEGETRTCTVTNLRLPRLEVRKVLSPATDGGRFDLYLDWRRVAQRVGNGGTTGLLRVAPGLHAVAELPARRAGQPGAKQPVTDLLGYRASIGGDCRPDGLVTLAPGEVKTCTITNTRLHSQVSGPECRAVCKRVSQACLAAGSRPGGPAAGWCHDLRERCLGFCH